MVPDDGPRSFQTLARAHLRAHGCGMSSLCSVGHGAAPAPGHTGLRPPPASVALRVSAPWRRGAPRKRGRAAGEVVQSADSGGAMLLVKQPLWVFGNGRSPAMALRLWRLRAWSPEPTPDRAWAERQLIFYYGAANL